MPTQDIGINVAANFKSSAAGRAIASLRDQMKGLAQSGSVAGKAFSAFSATVGRSVPLAAAAVAGFKLVSAGLKSLISIVVSTGKAFVSFFRSLLQTDRNIRVFNASLRQVQRAGGETGASIETLNRAFTNISLQTGKYRNDLVDLALKLTGVGAGQRDITDALIAASNASDVLGRSFREVGEAIFTAENVSTRSLSKLGVNVSNLTQEFLSQEGAIRLITEQFGDQVVTLQSISVFADRIRNAFVLAKDVIAETVLSSEGLRNFMSGVFASTIGFVRSLKESPELVEAIAVVFEKIFEVTISIVKLLPAAASLALGGFRRVLSITGLLKADFDELRDILGDIGIDLFDVVKRGEAVNSITGESIPILKNVAKSNEELLRLGKEYLRTATATNESEQERIDNLKEIVNQIEAATGARSGIAGLQDALSGLSGSMGGQGDITLEEALDFLRKEFADIRDGLNNDSQTQTKEVLGSLEALLRANELNALEIEEELSIIAYRVGEIDFDPELIKRAEIFPSLSELKGLFNNDVRDMLLADIGKIQTQANLAIYSLDKEQTQRERNHLKVLADLQNELLAADEVNAILQADATTQAERDAAQHLTNINKRNIRLDITQYEDGLRISRREHAETVAGIKESADEQSRVAKENAALLSDELKKQQMKDEEFNKVLLEIAQSLGAALASISNNQEVIDELQDIKDNYLDRFNESQKETVDAIDEFNDELKKSNRDLNNDILKIEAQRHRELLDIDRQRDRELLEAIKNLEGAGDAETLREAQEELDRITVESEERRNQTLARFEQQILESERSRSQQFEDEKAQAIKDNEDRREQLKDELAEAKKAAQEVNDATVNAAVMAGEAFAEEAAVKALNYWIPGLGDTFKILNDSAKANVDAASNFGRGIAKFLADAFKNIFGNLPRLIGAVIGGFIAEIPTLVEGIAKGIAAFLPSVLEGIGNVVGGIFGLFSGETESENITIRGSGLDELLDVGTRPMIEELDPSQRVRELEEALNNSELNLPNNPFRNPNEFPLFNRRGVNPSFSGASGQRSLVMALNDQLKELRRNNELLKENSNALGSFEDDEFGQPPQLRPGYRTATEAFNPYLDPSSRPDAGGTPVRLQIQIGDQRLRDILVNLQESGYTQVVGA